MPSSDVRGETFGDRLRREIRLAGFVSARKFAQHIGMEPNCLSRIINNQVKRPTPETLKKFAAGLEVPEAEVWRWAGISPAAPVKVDSEAPPTPDVLGVLIDSLRSDPEVMQQLRDAGSHDDDQVVRDIAEVLKAHIRSLARVRRVQ